ncbi:FUSC family protein [Aquabacter spiritensis]|uniref:Multidrug resistance protein MdtO n=1 Tax=Aquabacter spiritensis TaxID=933073 RepID=A0A4R3M0K7_9HYPH|nr:FUSC family protein [Aquabacter spiritensis]TCT05699.1 multidrug resistance protein MdtO [Aquabacter spiritensis]
MAAAADAPWPALARRTLLDLKPEPGRFAMTWKVALLCALVAAVAMVYRVPEAAIGCYLVIFLSRPNGAESVQQAIGVILLASVVVFAMAPVIQATADVPLLRICVIALVSFGFVFLGAASKLGEQGSIVALVIAFVLTLVDRLPIGEIATRGLLYAWQMAAMPMALMLLFNLVFGLSPQRLLRARAAARLEAAATALCGPPAARAARLEPLLGEGLEAGDQEVTLGRLFHTARADEMTWLAGAQRTTYGLALAVAALRTETSGLVSARLARACREAAAAVRLGHPAPASPPDLQEDQSPEERSPATARIATLLAALARPDGGTGTPPPKPAFMAADAFTNPDYQRYALKTTAAAILCYLTYSLIGWQGIHTAMITCYVAALGTMAETVHKLTLRICGCLVGAAIGVLSILFVIPHLESVGGLMALVFLGLLPAAWVAAGSERVSYAGVQIGLAFLLTVLNGFAPSLDMGSARDRIVGVLLGNLVVYLIFTSIWPKSAAKDIGVHLGRMLSTLSHLAALPPDARVTEVDRAARVATEAEKARAQMLLLPLEPASQRPDTATIARLRTLIETSSALLPALMFAPGRDATIADRLSRAAAAAVAAPPPSSAAADAVDMVDVVDGDASAETPADLVHRIERLVAR